MTESALHGHEHHHDVSSNTIFGFWIYLITDFILFATLFAAYAVLRNGTWGGPTARELFSLNYALSETLVLLTSSFTCGMGMLAVHRNAKKQMTAWFVITFLLGITFLGMVWNELDHLVQKGITWQTSAFLSSYFTLVGTHGLHIAFGLLFMIVFIAQALRRGITSATNRRLTCLSMFWFFSYVVWIFMFSIVYLMGTNG